MNVFDELYNLKIQRDYNKMLEIINKYQFNENNYSIQSKLLHYSFIAYYYKKDLENCFNVCKQFFKYTINDEFKRDTDYIYHLLKELNYTVIETCDTNIVPKEKEVIIYYGNYPDDYNSLPQSNQIYKNVMYLNLYLNDQFNFKKVYDKCWESVDKFFIMGNENNPDRINETIIQLSLMNAPLHKIHIEKGKNEESIYKKHLSCAYNHINCLKIMLDSGYNNCLFLEDDFTFTSSIERNKKNLLTFFERNYDYDICFLSASKFHKRIEHDDLLIISKQECTTSSGYLISKKNVEKVYKTVIEGINIMSRIIEDPNETNKNYKIHTYCIDRYWSKLNVDNKMFIFKDKLGFQKLSKSNITNQLNGNLD